MSDIEILALVTAITAFICLVIAIIEKEFDL